MCETGYRTHPWTKAQKKRHRKKSNIRVRVEHIFGFMTKTMKDGLNMRGIGMPRITAGIGLVNLVYTLARYEQSLRLKLA
jgi:transposase, IS5 family